MIPKTWLCKEVHLLWNAGCESMLWVDNLPVFSFSPMEDHGMHKSFRLSTAVTEEDCEKQ